MAKCQFSGALTVSYSWSQCAQGNEKIEMSVNTPTFLIQLRTWWKQRENKAELVLLKFVYMISG